MKPTGYVFRLQHCGVSARLNHRGFTLVELITVIVIVGVLAVAAIPRFFDKNTFDSRGYYDQVISTLRFAQKTAVAQHRFVCVTFSANSITLTFDPIPPSTVHLVAICPGNPLTSPAGVTPFTVTAPTIDVTLSSFADFNFNALGRPSIVQPGTGIAVSGYATPIVVEAETGYVH